MDKFEPTRYADHRPMLIGGLRRHHTFADAPRGIPAQWQEVQTLGPIPGQIGTTTYGISCGADAKGMEYMCGVEVESLEALPAGMDRMRIPAQHYAVFEHRGHISGIGETWRRILEEWLPNAACESAHTPDFEVYDQCYDTKTGTGDVEIWISVTRENRQTASR